MNVLMVQNSYKGCGYVRMKLPAYHNGYDIVDTKNDFKEKAMNADVIVFHRPEDPTYYDIAKILKEAGKKIVMDNDDTFILSWHPLCQFTPEAVKVDLEKRKNSIRKFIKLSDLVTTTTETLAKEYRKDNDNVVILPNCVDPFDWEEPLRNESDKVRIGLVGSTSMEYDYLEIKGVLRELSARDDVQLCMFGLGDAKHRKDNPKVEEAFKEDHKFWDSLDIDHKPWCEVADYPTELNDFRLDFMLIPRKDNYFNRCKSNLKFLEASMCEVPVIAQSFDNAPYEEIGNMGILIKDNKDWEKEVNRLIDDKKLRRDMGKRAKQYVLDNYNIENNYTKWADVYKKLYEKN